MPIYSAELPRPNFLIRGTPVICVEDTPTGQAVISTAEALGMPEYEHIAFSDPMVFT